LRGKSLNIDAFRHLTNEMLNLRCRSRFNLYIQANDCRLTI
jgi:hypothetical protein